MNCKFDKVITITDDLGYMNAIIVHDVEHKTKRFYRVEEMGMDEILDLMDPHAKVTQMGKSKDK